MTDNVDRATRSRMMAAVRSKHTAPELKLRRALHAAGFRFRLHRHDLPGKPDLTLPKYKVAIFVHGCFWHRHSGCPRATNPKSNVPFWRRKFDQNVKRDAMVKLELQAVGWRVATVWTCAIEDSRQKRWIALLQRWIVGKSRAIEIPNR